MGFLATWLVLAAFWVVLSGHWDAVHLVFGFLAVTLVTVLSRQHLRPEGTLASGLGRLVRLLRYAPWLLLQVVQANWDVFLRVLGVRPLDPCVVRVRPGLSSDFGRVALANSITLTPGTVTVTVDDDGSMVVHAIAPAAAVDLVVDGKMAARVRWVETGRR